MVLAFLESDFPGNRVLTVCFRVFSGKKILKPGWFDHVYCGLALGYAEDHQTMIHTYAVFCVSRASGLQVAESRRSGNIVGESGTTDSIAWCVCDEAWPYANVTGLSFPRLNWMSV